MILAAFQCNGHHYSQTLSPQIEVSVSNFPNERCHFQRYASSVQDYLRVAPLFETLDDLDNSTATMERLLSNEWYRSHINGVQEVMIGYSDSGKDAGRMSAAWGLFQVQESLVKVAKVRAVTGTNQHNSTELR